MNFTIVRFRYWAAAALLAGVAWASPVGVIRKRLGDEACADGPPVAGRVAEPRRQDPPAPEPQEEPEKQQSGHRAETPEEKAIEKLFNARLELFMDDGRIRLLYLFAKPSDLIAKDFVPDFTTTEKRIRWAQGSEGVAGIVISEHGLLLHRALWKRVQVKFNMSALSATAAKDHVAAVFTDDKGKRCIGSVLGRQLIVLKNNRLSGKPLPAGSAVPTTIHSQALDFGISLSDGAVFAALERGEIKVKSSDGADWPGFKLGAGQIGLAWNGNVKCAISGMTIDGELDPEWLKAALAQ